MAAVEYNRDRFVTQPIGTVSNLVRSLVGTVTRWNDARVTRKVLSGLSAHELEDIGLNRGDIDRVIARRLG